MTTAVVVLLVFGSFLFKVTKNSFVPGLGVIVEGIRRDRVFLLDRSSRMERISRPDRNLARLKTQMLTSLDLAPHVGYAIAGFTAPGVDRRLNVL